MNEQRLLATKHRKQRLALVQRGLTTWHHYAKHICHSPTESWALLAVFSAYDRSSEHLLVSTRQLLLLLLLLLLRAVVGSRDWAALGCVEIDGAACCRQSGRASWISRRAGVGPARSVEHGAAVGRTAAGGERRRRGGADSHAASRRSRLGSQLSGGDVASPARAGAEHSTAHSDDRAEPLRGAPSQRPQSDTVLATRAFSPVAKSGGLHRLPRGQALIAPI